MFRQGPDFQFEITAAVIPVQRGQDKESQLYSLLFFSWKNKLFLAHLSSAQDELLWSFFVRRASVRHFQTTSPLKPLSQFCLNFICSLLRVGEWKIAKMVTVCWPRWPLRPYMVKIFKNLLLQNRECLGAEPLQESSGKGGLPKLLKELLYVDVWPFYGKIKFASLCICMGKTFKNLLLQNRACLMAESLCISSGTGRLPKLLK